MTQISIIGGDLRIVQLAEILSKEEFGIYTYGLEKLDIINKKKRIHKCSTLEEAVEKSNIIISSIPLLNDKNCINMPFSDEKIESDELTKMMNSKIFHLLILFY